MNVLFKNNVNTYFIMKYGKTDYTNKEVETKVVYVDFFIKL